MPENCLVVSQNKIGVVIVGIIPHQIQNVVPAGDCYRDGWGYISSVAANPTAKCCSSLMPKCHVPLLDLQAFLGVQVLGSATNPERDRGEKTEIPVTHNIYWRADEETGKNSAV